MRRTWGFFLVLVFLSVSARIAVGEEMGSLPVTGRAEPGLEPFDRLMTTFLAEHHVAGAALAVTRNGRLVYARGFGWADKETRAKVEPASRFRIASLTKPITAVAVLRLV